MQASVIERPWLSLFAAIPVVMVSALIGASVPAASLSPLLIENGPFETASVVLHLMVGGYALYAWRKGNRIAGVLFLACLLMAARELDLHKAFTTYGIFGTRLYFRDYVPLHEKILAASAIGVILASLGTLLWRAKADLRRLCRERRPAFYSLCALPLYVLFLKEVDGMPRMLRKIGVILSERTIQISKSIEEIGETFIPALVLLILIQLVRSEQDKTAA